MNGWMDRDLRGGIDVGIDDWMDGLMYCQVDGLING